MQAILYEAFGAPPKITTVPDPKPDADAVVVRVGASGICRSDWHGWMGHDPSISLPHVPGHELAGTVEECGANVTRWRPGDRVTVPFVGGCGVCPQCRLGNQQVCDAQFQPGFTHWGSFAQYVALKYADTNVVRLPEAMDFVTAASLGCRLTTAYRAVVAQGRTAPGQWLAVHGCGGVGLSAIMIAHAIGAQVVGVDINPDALALARSFGAAATLNAHEVVDTASAVRDLTGGGAHVSLDALGHPVACVNSILSLRKRGRHVQAGLMLADQSTPAIPMDQVIARELELVGSHGMQAHQFPALFELIASGKIDPRRLVQRTVSLAESPDELVNMGRFDKTGITVIDRF